MKDKITPDNITALKPYECFVFGSNLAGRHGAGAAKTAMGWGAIYRKGWGKQGNTYAIPSLAWSNHGGRVWYHVANTNDPSIQYRVYITLWDGELQYHYNKPETLSRVNINYR